MTLVKLSGDVRAGLAVILTCYKQMLALLAIILEHYNRKHLPLPHFNNRLSYFTEHRHVEPTHGTVRYCDACFAAYP